MRVFLHGFYLESTPYTRPEQYVPRENKKSCSSVLSQLDKVWDERRKARLDTNHPVSDNPVRFFDLYEPEATCFTEERFGARGDKRYDTFGDGPKFVCGIDLLAAENGNCLVYSIGSKNNIAFEVSVKHFLGCETHTFDPTIDSFVGSDYATWHLWELGKDNIIIKIQDHTFSTMSLKTINRQLFPFCRRCFKNY